ncbi:hypothetical protein AMAG_04284 [Allomyces macrogynus ATCC 38327]|uniref:Uncharacterized protein n=1 Tax=Allomyces macrogynus (strain ATCC 38327) TaxID=578462 RepID=A0A0L0S8K3_ALLM3|nr:hypothetical protein AMAG_04284 [Allomyces macrogynus ATCC 38327]|eukprot:KNE58730.1 hypothetical protein AMAG_04284 [Allomyces macrogynus ATCC 38327]
MEQQAVPIGKKKRARAAPSARDTGPHNELDGHGNIGSSTIASATAPPPPPAKRARGASKSVKKAPRKRSGTAGSSSTGADAPSAGAPTWPASLNELARVFAALNTTGSFLAARGVALTFTKIKKAVDQNAGVAMTLDHARAILHLAPDLVDMAWTAPDDGNTNQHAYADDVAAHNPLRSLRPANAPLDLAISFKDTLRLNAATSQAKQLLKLVEARNKAFRAAIDRFAQNCAVANLDPETALTRAITSLLPDDSRKVQDQASPPSLVSLTAGANPDADATPPNSVFAIWDEITTQPFYKHQITATNVSPARAAHSAPWPFDSPRFQQALVNFKGIRQPYSHQAAAISSILAGEHIIISTSTSSGKSLVYHVPILLALEHDRNARFLYVCPTKALAQDQLRAFRAMIQSCPHLADWVQIATYDGDTPAADRAAIRERAHILLTNPDMLHITIMPNAHEWNQFLMHLKYVVVDEVHAYHGVFGSHCAWIFRRLRRLTDYYQNLRVQFIACSATIGNAEEHARDLFGTDFTHISEDGSPHGQRATVIWNPPALNSLEPRTNGLVARASSLEEAAAVFQYLTTRNVKTVAFAKYRAACELLFKHITGRPGMTVILDRVRSYRGGYHPEERRRTEQALASGELVGVVATNALELGIDIGGIDAVIHVGFPGIAAMKQQAGRAGRRTRDSLSILVPDANPLDQFYARNPERIWDAPLPAVAMDPRLPALVEAHLVCAAFELPIDPDNEPVLAGFDLQEPMEKRLTQGDNQRWEAREMFPSHRVPIRTIPSDSYAVVDVTRPPGVILEYVEGFRAPFTLYNGGIFLHQGKSYSITNVSPEKMVANVCFTSATWYTSCQDITNVDPIRTATSRPVGRVVSAFGPVELTTMVYGYHKIDLATRSILDTVELKSPPMSRTSSAWWIDIPTDLVRALGCAAAGANAAYAPLHSLNHAILHALPSVVSTSAPTDESNVVALAPVACECRGIDSTRARPFRLTVFDRAATAVGTARRAWERGEGVVRAARELMAECPCDVGCPECIFWKSCTHRNELHDKARAIHLADLLLDGTGGVDGEHEDEVGVGPCEGHKDVEEKSAAAPFTEEGQ